MISPSLHTLRLFLHVMAACVWVGGQIVLGGLVPTLRKHAPDVVGKVAQAYNRLAWPAFGVLVVTGIWNVAEVNVSKTSTAYQVTLAVKLLVVVASGLGAALHVLNRSKIALAVGGSLAALGGIAAVWLGLALHS